MKRPRYIEKLYAGIFLAIAIVFILMGLLGYAGILKPTSHSKVQDPQIMAGAFATVGVSFWILYAIAKTMDFMKHKLHKKLITEGEQVSGRVDKIYMRKNIHFGRKSPYVITYSYTHNDENHSKKSCLLWEKPDIKAGEEITVYVNKSGKTTLKI